MTDLAASGVIQSSKGARERVSRLAPGILPFLDRDASTSDWINWPVLLSAAERVWFLVDGLCAAELEPEVVESEISLVTRPVFDRFALARWMPPMPMREQAAGTVATEVFQGWFEVVSR